MKLKIRALIEGTEMIGISELKANDRNEIYCDGISWESSEEPEKNFQTDETPTLIDAPEIAEILRAFCSKEDIIDWEII